MHPFGGFSISDLSLDGCVGGSVVELEQLNGYIVGVILGGW